jgi:hypothetical protein
MYVNISSQWYRPLVQLIVSNRKSTWNIIDEWTSVTCYLMYEDVLLMTPDKYLSHRFYFSSPNRNDHLKFFNHLGSIFIRNKPFSNFSEITEPFSANVCLNHILNSGVYFQNFIRWSRQPSNMAAVTMNRSYV